MGSENEKMTTNLAHSNRQRHEAGAARRVDVRADTDTDADADAVRLRQQVR
jgi:hypothetical protein